jgi:hypothetical protein
MKQVNAILFVAVLSSGFIFMCASQHTIFVPQNHSSFLGDSVNNQSSTDNATESNDITPVAIEEYNQSVDEYDTVISIDTEPVKLSPLQSFFARIFGKLILYYFIARDSMQACYKKYKDKVSTIVDRR